MRLRSVGYLIVLALFCRSQSVPAQENEEEMVTAARKFIQRYLEEIRPIEIQANLAWWDANTSGKDDDFARKEQAENRLNAALSDQSSFAQLKSLREAGLGDPVLRRQIEVLYLKYLEKQVDPELLRHMTAKANQIEQAFNVYRAQVDGESLTDSQVRKLLIGVHGIVRVARRSGRPARTSARPSKPTCANWFAYGTRRQNSWVFRITTRCS